MIVVINMRGFFSNMPTSSKLAGKWHWFLLVQMVLKGMEGPGYVQMGTSLLQPQKRNFMIEKSQRKFLYFVRRS